MIILRQSFEFFSKGWIWGYQTLEVIEIQKSIIQTLLFAQVAGLKIFRAISAGVGFVVWRDPPRDANAFWASKINEMFRISQVYI